MAQVKTYSALVKEINKRVTIAIQNVAKITCDKLKECIDEQYYQDPSFYPNIYQRTEQKGYNAKAQLYRTPLPVALNPWRSYSYKAFSGI